MSRPHGPGPWQGGRRCGNGPIPADKRWCLWHQDCTKDDFHPEVQRLRVFDECTVDAVERYSIDLRETRVSHRVLDPKHANKNALRAIFGQLVKHKEHVADTVQRFVSNYKPGGWIVCAMRPV